MRTPIQVRHPGLRVTLRKNVGRDTGGAALAVSERFSGQKRVIDLTPYFGEGSSVQVNKSVREPAGAFSMTFTDKLNPDAADSIYGLVEPMDVIEIRMAGDAYASGEAAQQLPIMMRGLVTRPQRVEAIGANGQPQRAVMVSGQDYGKIWQIIQITNSPFVDPKANFITNFPFFARFGQTVNTEYAETFVKDVFDKIVNPYIARMQDKGGGAASPVQTIDTGGIVVKDGIISPFGVGAWQGGTIYDLLSMHCDTGPWNELYIEDRESGPRVVYRPNPFMSADGKAYIMPVEVEPDFVAITRADILNWTVGRSDESVANYFWVESPRFALNYDDTLRLMSFQARPEDVYQQGYGNNDPDLYGFRRLQAATAQGGRDETNNGNGTQDGGDRTINQTNAIAWLNQRRAQLREINKDNVVLESGSAVLKGNERIRAGVYLRLKHGNMESDYYVASASHNYAPFGSYTTSVRLERGTGFIDRVKQGGGLASPYLSELGDA